MLNSTLAVPNAVGLSAALDMSGYDVDSPLCFQLLGAGSADAVTVWMTDNASATSLSVSNAVSPAALVGAAPRQSTSQVGTSILGAPRPRYLYAQRTAAGATGVTLSITGRETPGTTGGGSATSIIPTLAVGDTAVAGNIGALTAAQTVDAYSAFTLTQTTAGNLALTLASPSTVTATRVVSVEYLAASTQDCTFYGVQFTSGTAATVQMVWNGVSWTRAQPSLTLGGNNVGAAVTFGTTDAQNVRGILGGTVFLTATAASGNLTVTGVGTGAAIFNSGTTGNVSLGTGAAGVDASAKTVFVATGAAVKTLTAGSQTGASVTTIQGGTSPAGADAVLVTVGAAGIITINPSTTGQLNLGTDTTGVDANAKTIRIGTGTGGNTISIGGAGAGANTINIGAGTGVQTIHIGDGAAANVITVGSVTGAASLALNAGSGGITGSTATNGNINFTANGTGVATLDTGAGGTVTVAGAAVAQTVNLGTGNAVKAINVGTGTSGNTISIGGAGAGANTINIGAGTGVQTIHIGDGAAANVITVGSLTGAASLTLQAGTGNASLTTATTGTITIASGTTGAVSLDSGTTGAVNIGTGAAAKTVTIGNSTGATAVTINAGTGAINIGTSAAARSINIGTGAAVQTIVVGSSNATSSLDLVAGTTRLALIVNGRTCLWPVTAAGAGTKLTNDGAGVLTWT